MDLKHNLCTPTRQEHIELLLNSADDDIDHPLVMNVKPHMNTNLSQCGEEVEVVAAALCQFVQTCTIFE